MLVVAVGVAVLRGAAVCASVADGSTVADAEELVRISALMWIILVAVALISEEHKLSVNILFARCRSSNGTFFYLYRNIIFYLKVRFCCLGRIIIYELFHVATSRTML